MSGSWSCLRFSFLLEMVWLERACFLILPVFVLKLKLILSLTKIAHFIRIYALVILNKYNYFNFDVYNGTF